MQNPTLNSKIVTERAGNLPIIGFCKKLGANLSGHEEGRLESWKFADPCTQIWCKSILYDSIFQGSQIGPK